ncbi:MAG: pyruvate dehydrogenase E1 component subunit beta [Microgenomates group bacterium Gr01-1014_7]|nr:MAG: pyruvate dehydrogenase E1 component subunit beta [Microgenomates group bacterium Gr01-1014_7]
MNKQLKLATKKISYRTAINQALHQEMERDNSIFTYGIDVADHKRIFGSTTGLLETFGPQRVFSTPLSEEALLGFGLGAAINGLRPINVHIRVDFLLLAINQLVNMVASYHYGSDGKLQVPLVIRAIIGKGWGQSYQHSKSLQSFFAHIPGLKVVMPTTPADAKGLLISAIRDNNPVVVLEHRMLYDVEDEVPIKPIPTPLGKGQILKIGTDITIIATSYSVVSAVQAAKVLEKQGVSVEVVDPRSIFPLDENLIIKSVEKTGHCIIADYDWTFCGFSAELATRIYEKLSHKLKSEVMRLGFAPTHCPSTRPLENEFYTDSIDLIRAVEKKLKLKEMDLSQETFYSYENQFRGPF